LNKLAQQHIDSEVKKTADIIRRGGIVLYPTDTLWGIGCDPFNDKALKKIYQLKQRIEIKSMIILVCESESIYRFVDKPTPIAFDLIEQWKKPLTIVFPRAKNLPKILLQEDNTIAIRVTKERFTYSLLKELNHPITATSANFSGEPAPLNFKFISQNIKNNVDYIVDYRRDGFSENKASTIIKIDDNGSFEVLRP